MQIESYELQEYINAILTSVRAGVQGTGFKITKPVLFDLAITNTAERNAGFRIYVAKADGKLKSEEINRIKFEIDSDNPPPALPTATVSYPNGFEY